MKTPKIALEILRQIVEYAKHKAWDNFVGDKKAKSIIDNFHNGAYGSGEGVWVQVDEALNLINEIIKDSEMAYPKSFEDLGRIDGYYVYSDGGAKVPKTCYAGIDTRADRSNIDIAPTREYCEAWIALCQLLQLRERYIEIAEPGWVANYTNGIYKYVIYDYEDELSLGLTMIEYRVLSFPSYKVCTLFLENFRDLLEVAKPLL